MVYMIENYQHAQSCLAVKQSWRLPVGMQIARNHVFRNLHLNAHDYLNALLAADEFRKAYHRQQVICSASEGTTQITDVRKVPLGTKLV